MSDRQPADSPREAVHEIVNEYIRALRGLGLAPNRGVTFRGDCPPGGPPDLMGWMFDDHHADGAWHRWLLLEDGDVWHEATHIAAGSGAGVIPEYEWLQHPTEALDRLLRRSLASARLGGRAGMSDDERSASRPFLVGDRRRGPEAYGGSDRRRHD